MSQTPAHRILPPRSVPHAGPKPARLGNAEFGLAHRHQLVGQTLSNLLIGARGTLVLAVALGSSPAIAADPASTVGFAVGSAVVIRNACGFRDDPGGIGRLLVNARISKADIAPGGPRRAAFEAGGDEARLNLRNKLEREGRERFCAFAMERYGPGGLGVVQR